MPPPLTSLCRSTATVAHRPNTPLNRRSFAAYSSLIRRIFAAHPSWHVASSSHSQEKLPRTHPLLIHRSPVAHSLFTGRPSLAAAVAAPTAAGHQPLTRRPLAVNSPSLAAHPLVHAVACRATRRAPAAHWSLTRRRRALPYVAHLFLTHRSLAVHSPFTRRSSGIARQCMPRRPRNPPRTRCSLIPHPPLTHRP